MKTPFFKDEYATIELDETIPCIFATLNGVPKSSEHFREVQLKRIELIEREVHNYPKLHVLTDSTLAGPVLDEDVLFYQEVILPRMSKAGIRYIAIVMPVNRFAQLTVKAIINAASTAEVRNFPSLRDARAWLKKMTTA